MSKKKSSTTMTLKDFHGGSIPSQLALPSAPASSNGSSRPPDRPGAWSAATAAAASGRSDLHHHLLRPRPGSAGSSSARSLDDRPPAFLAHPSHMGRHFDEDERKPFDASSAPRRSPVPDNALRSPPPPRSDPKRPLSSPVVPSPVTVPAPVSAFPPPSTNVGSAPGAWGLRKEVGIHSPPSLPTQPAATVWSASRLAQASAVEKVTSGRWQLRPPEVEIMRSQESEDFDRKFVDSVRVVDGIGRERERPSSVSSAATYPEGKERTSQVLHPDRAFDLERARSTMYSEVKESTDTADFLNEGVSLAVEVSERPKLKLLPRGKPLESPAVQTRDFNDKQVYQTSVSLVQVQNVHEMQMHGSVNNPKLGSYGVSSVQTLNQNVHEMYGNANPPKPSSAGADEGIRAIDRPKLNLKPRSQPIYLSGRNADRERNTVFGGARPRELVLKERGIDVLPNDLDMITSPNRARNDLPRTDSKTFEPNATHQTRERFERAPAGQRTGKDLEKKGDQADPEKSDLRSPLWRNDNRRNARENGKPLESPRADTDNWRKPIEQPKLDTPPPRFGKASSALELAQAYSKSVSDGRTDNHFSSQRNIPGQAKLPFSRLTDTRDLYSGPPHRQINGY